MTTQTLSSQLDAVFEGFKANAPLPAQNIINDARSSIMSTFDASTALKVGDKLPAFKLPNALGEEITSADLLAKGPILISFYRGNWCPYCNVALRSLQQHLNKFHARGIELVAISPELPDTSLSTKEKNELKFHVLSDVGNKYARQLGIVWKQPDSLRPVFEQFGNNMKKNNGDDSLEVPIPANFLVGKDGVVKGAYIEPDYTKRLEPEKALEWFDKM